MRGPGTSRGREGPFGGLSALAHPALLAACALAAAVDLIGRFFVRPGLWLDEALSVNIARLPIGEIGEALKHDGHPPFFYLLLHGWMDLFGTGDRAVRALSAVFSFACLPLAYRLGRRFGGSEVGWLTAFVLAVSPYLLRYGSEARMYALIIFLVFAGSLVVLNALEGPSAGWLAAVAAITSALLWTHYWSMWLLGGVGVVLVARVIRQRRRAGVWDRPGISALAAMGVGAATFVPWLPTMLFQAEHTGTPWAKVFRPSTLVVQSWQEFSGGPYSEPQVLAMFVVVVLFVGLFGRSVDDWHIELDLRTRPAARPIALVLVAVVAVACIGGIATGTTFAPRYASIYFPFYVLLVAIGLAQFRGRAVRTISLTAFVVLSLVGSFVVLRLNRTQAVVASDLIAKSGETDAVVAVCPDQLGPSTSRALGEGYDVAAYPDLRSPLRVDWVDYAERNRNNDPAAFASKLLERAGNRTIFFVFDDKYETLVGQWSEALQALATQRSLEQLMVGRSPEYFETMSLYRLDPPSG